MRRLKFGLDPLISKKRDHCTIQVSSSGMLTGSFAEVFSSVLLRSWSDRSLMLVFGSHHGVTEAERAVRELERNFPVAGRKALRWHRADR